MRDPQRLEERVEDRREGRRVFPFHGARRIRRTFPPAICPSTAHATKAGIPHALTWLDSRRYAITGTESGRRRTTRSRISGIPPGRTRGDIQNKRGPP